MNSQSISRLFISLVVMLGAVYMAFDIVSAGGNAMGKLYQYILFGSMLFGFLFPRAGFFYLLFLSAYLDFFKRLMIFDSGVTLMDLYCVLGIAPLTLAGILGNVAYQQLQDSSRLAKGQITWMFWVILMMGLAITAQLLSGGNKGQKFGEAVNLGAYMALLITVPYLFKTPQELQRLLKIVVLMYLPAGIYMIYHGFEGITDWEMAYVKSGMTVEIRQLNEVKFRPFGTLNSAASASSVFSLLAVLALLGPWDKEDEQGIGRKGLGVGLRFVAFVIFTAAAFFTITRTGWVQGVAAIVAVFMFYGSLRTKLFYAISVSAVVALFFSASWLLRTGLFEEAMFFVSGLASSETQHQAIQIGTFTDRLQSYSLIFSDTRMLTPFGWKLSGRPMNAMPFTHDAVTEFILKVGYVPVIIMLVLGVYFVIRMHRVVLGEKASLNKSLAVISAASFFSYALGGMANGSQLRMFPVNFFLWLFPAVIVSLEFHRRKTAAMAPAVSRGRQTAGRWSFQNQQGRGMARAGGQVA